MSKEWRGFERRGHPRVSASGVKGVEESGLEALVVNVSISGALLEVSYALPSRSRYVVKLTLPDRRSLALAGEVVRSYVHGFDKDSSGHPAVRYRAAIQFVDVTEEQRQHLEKLVVGRDHLTAELSS